MKTIEIDEDLYRYIAMQTQDIGESASDILRRLLLGDSPVTQQPVEVKAPAQTDAHRVVENAVSETGLFAHLEHIGVAKQKRTVDRFLSILASMAKFNPDSFSRVLELRGRNRVYFATSKEQLLSSGSSTNPKQLPESHYWVVTNNNTKKKGTMLQEVARVLRYSDAQCQQLLQLLDPATEEK